jgi:Cysteine rich repeat
MSANNGCRSAIWASPARLIVALAVIALACVPARSQDAPRAPKAAVSESLRAAMSAARAACADDVKKLCAGVQPGAGRIRRCIGSHRDQLQPTCRDAAAKVRTLRQASRPGGNAPSGRCAQDIKSFCAGVERGGGRIVRCLKQHAGELQPGCRSVVATDRSRQQ